MRRNKLFIIIVGLLILGGCVGSVKKQAATFSDSLIVLSGAENIQYTKLEESEQLLFEIKEEYPAKSVLEKISSKLEAKAWRPSSEDFLNPGLPSSHGRWMEFFDVTKPPERQIHQWSGQWENKNGDIILCFLRYSYPTNASPDLTNLLVVETLFPAKYADELKKNVIVYTSRQDAGEGGRFFNGEIGGGKIIDSEYIHEKKGYKINLPPQEWIPGPGTIPDICFNRDGSYMLVAVFDVEEPNPFENVNTRWKEIMIRDRSWTDVKTLDEKSLTMDGHDAKVVVFEYTQFNIRYVTMAYHIWRPGETYNYYRIRLNCYEDKFEEYKDDFQTFANSFSFL